MSYSVLAKVADFVLTTLGPDASLHGLHKLMC